MGASRSNDAEMAQRPAGYQGPNLSPRGLTLMPQELAPGTFALMANIAPKDNNGLIVGSRSALVVDAGIVPDVSLQIQKLTGRLSDVPLRFLINTTYHGDHTFGNAAFPDSVTIVSSRTNRDQMNDLGYEKERRTGNMYGDGELLEAVHNWRRPDLVFEHFAEIDLGDKDVQLFHFGPGNGPGDTIVYDPDVRVIWTGNYLCHAGIAPMLLQGGPAPYLQSLQALRAALPDVEVVVPGHGPLGSAPDAISWLADYLKQLLDSVADAIAAGKDLAQTQQEAWSPFRNGLDPRVVTALETRSTGSDQSDRLLALMRHLHRLNVMATYRALTDSEQPVRSSSL